MKSAYNTMHVLALSGVAFLSTTVFSAVAGNNPHSGVRFKLDFRSPDAEITSRSVGNAVNYSGETAVNAATAGGIDEATSVSHRIVRASPVIYPWQTNSVDVLHFPQHSIVEDEKIKVMPTAVDFNDSAVASPVQTVYMRFRWDGCVNTNVTVHQWMLVNGYKWGSSDGTGRSGFSIGLNYDKANPGRSQPVVMLPQVSKTSWSGGVTVYTNVWYDFFVVLKPDGSHTEVTFSLVKKPTKKWVGNSEYTFTSLPPMSVASLVLEETMTFYDSDPTYRRLRLGAENTATSYMDSESNWGSYSKCFRGDIARAVVWDRELTENEMWQVVSDASGVDWKLGLDNGSADEFSDDADASGVWRVTNGWFNVRRALTEAKPTWTVKCPVVSREAGKDKILEIIPILSGGTSFPVEVAVNGEKTGEWDLAHARERAVPIKGRFWKAGADGLATITVTRKAPFAGTLELDSMALCGGWRMQGTMSDVGYIRPEYAIGSTDPKTVLGGTNVLPDRQNGTPLTPAVSISAYVPAPACVTHEYAFSFKVASRTTSECELPHALLVNGQEAFRVDDVATGQDFSCKIPNSLLVAGENVFTLTNMASIVEGQSKWVVYSFYDISVKGHMYGLSVVIR